ncbi:hypothetical protein D9611_007001 [Ephemerocybe angulata]|uniref:Uncharacterized protein n=1 Tax=Ephemerocybe angulata TaxID=980116 RepID=A0A8H5B287_9AGAR|nr:hypothetical protein D9611_007001 [Tulosesus angulatus]
MTRRGTSFWRMYMQVLWLHLHCPRRCLYLMSIMKTPFTPSQPTSSFIRHTTFRVVVLGATGGRPTTLPPDRTQTGTLGMHKRRPSILGQGSLSPPQALSLGLITNCIPLVSSQVYLRQTEKHGYQYSHPGSGHSSSYSTAHRDGYPDVQQSRGYSPDRQSNPPRPRTESPSAEELASHQMSRNLTIDNSELYASQGQSNSGFYTGVAHGVEDASANLAQHRRWSFPAAEASAPGHLMMSGPHIVLTGNGTSLSHMHGARMVVPSQSNEPYLVHQMR